jgi:nucleotide-binding universal stress UspA family protein
METINYEKILVTTDGSDYSYKAGEHAIYLARITGARLYILNVVNVDMAFHSGIHYAEGVSELEKTGNEATGKIRELCRNAGIHCEEIITKGSPADVIVDIGEKMDVDCIVMGSIGTSAIERILIGSVSEKVLRHAKCPVLLVRSR